MINLIVIINLQYFPMINHFLDKKIDRKTNNNSKKMFIAHNPIFQILSLNNHKN